MLSKLLKYDFKSIFKFISVFYILAIFFSVLTRIFLSVDNSFVVNILGEICKGAAISMMVSILINSLMRLWVRFKSNFYGDESYLTHTLPVSKSNLYLSKTLTSIIILFLSILVIGISLFVMFYSKETIEWVKNMLLPLINTYDSTILKVMLAFLFIFFLEFLNGVQAGFTGIILGHKMNNMKTGFSVLFGFAAYMITQTFGLLMIFIVAIFNKDLMNLFITNDMINIDMVKLVIYLSISIYGIGYIVWYFINLKLFEKGVNVD